MKIEYLILLSYEEFFDPQETDTKPLVALSVTMLFLSLLKYLYSVESQGQVFFRVELYLGNDKKLDVEFRPKNVTPAQSIEWVLSVLCDHFEVPLDDDLDKLGL